MKNGSDVKINERCLYGTAAGLDSADIGFFILVFFIFVPSITFNKNESGVNILLIEQQVWPVLRLGMHGQVLEFG